MQKILSALKHIHQMTGVPIYLYSGTRILHFFSYDGFTFLPSKQFIDYFLRNDRELDYHSTDFFAYFGSVKVQPEPDLRIIIGPAFQMSAPQQSFEQLKKSYVVSKEESEPFLAGLDHFPVVSFTQFLNILKSIAFFINNTEIHTRDILKTKDKLLIEHQAAVRTFENRENLHYNNSYAVESRVCRYVENGELEKVTAFIEESFEIHEGKMSPDELRQAKNTAIVFITLITRAAIRGDSDMDSTFQLSDRFIQQIESYSSREPIQHLMQEVLFELTDRVRKIKMGEVNDPEFTPLIRYIKKNINQPLSVTMLADEFGYSRSYLSTLFKKKSNISLQAFITKCKIDEAKQLLTCTDKPISTISNYLCFSSQSHFQTAFKKAAGVSPAKYRRGM